MELTPDDWQRENLPPLTVPCPPAPDGCGSAAGELCTSHDGTRARNSQVHRARTAAWEAARYAANPAAQLVAEAVARSSVRGGSQAAKLLHARGHTAEAERVRAELRARNGLMSAKQAAAFLLDTPPGEPPAQPDTSPATTETRTVETGYGPLAVPLSLLRIWNKYGWPEDRVLKRMTEVGTVGIPAEE